METKMMTVTEMANLLSLSGPMAYKLIREGKVASIRVGKKILVNRESFEEFIKGTKNKESMNVKRKKRNIKNKSINKAINKPINKIINKIIAVDFDGTLVEDKYPSIGRPNYFLIACLIELSKNNTLILWTCRNGQELKDAIDFCTALGLKFNYVNENTKEVLESYNNVDSRKITADIYIDDKNVLIDDILADKSSDLTSCDLVSCDLVHGDAVSCDSKHIKEDTKNEV